MASNIENGVGLFGGIISDTLVVCDETRGTSFDPRESDPPLCKRVH